jgi:hypothetical protein
MKYPQSNSRKAHAFPAFHATSMAAALAISLLGATSRAWAGPGEDNRAPDVPAVLEAPGGTNKVHFHAYALGVQIYTNDPTRLVWGFKAPEAVLFAADGNGEIGIHYAGPTWESQSGSKVVGAVVPPRVTVDTNAIPWLLLRAVSSEGPGIFGGTTYIQRVNTTGGLAPATPPTPTDTEVRVPYTAEYFFYRATD